MGTNLNEEPLRAIAEISITEFSLIQIINFYYYDPDRIYSKISNNINDEKYVDEFNNIIENMQGFLDEDSVFLNKN